MADYNNNNTGVLFKNENKKSDKAPDYRGKLTDENGKEWDLAAWVKTSQKGNKFLSLKVSPPYKKGEPEYAHPEAQRQHNEAKSDIAPSPADDDLPF